MSGAEYGSPEDRGPSLLLIAVLTLIAVGLTLIAGAMIRSDAADYRQACRDRGGVTIQTDRLHVICTVNGKIVEVRP